MRWFCLSPCGVFRRGETRATGGAGSHGAGLPTMDAPRLASVGLSVALARVDGRGVTHARAAQDRTARQCGQAADGQTHGRRGRGTGQRRRQSGELWTAHVRRERRRGSLPCGFVCRRDRDAAATPGRTKIYKSPLTAARRVWYNSRRVRQVEVESRPNTKSRDHKKRFPALASLRTRAHFLPCLGGNLHGSI